MNSIQKLLKKIDNFQRSHTVVGFPYAVVKKYGEDHGGYQSALITYYGLLSLFPLLIVFTAVTQLVLKNDPALQARISHSVAQYFPIVGNQLQKGVHSPSKTGLALAISLLITLYGARGGASALQYAISSLWHVPKVEHPPFLKNMLRSFGIIFGGGLGLVGAAVISGYTNILGRGPGIRVLASLISVLILWVTFAILFKLAIAGNKSFKNVAVGSGIAAIGIQILQTLGGVILGHQLKGLDSAYGTFALVIGLLFWIYLQAQVILYAVEVDVVRAYKLFPRSLQEPLTAADKLALSQNAQAQTQYKYQSVDVSFSDKPA
jgi:membrane protein